MSAAIEPAPDKPWMKVAIIAAIVVGVVCVMIFFSGRWGFGRHHKDEQRATEVVMPKGIPALVRPSAVQAVSETQPKKEDHRALAKSPEIDKERLAALNSPLDIYVAQHTNQATSTSAPAQRPPMPALPDVSALTPPDALEASLTPTKLDGTRVAELPDPRWLIEQGRILPCTQQTRINSTLMGGVTAVLSENIFGETGDTPYPLLPKGSRVFGTIQHALVNGLDRLAVLWQNITTPIMYGADGMPHQYRIATNSPAASELGETGLDGDVNRHLGLKIGGIIGISMIQGAIQAGVSYAGRSNGNGTTLNLNSFQSGGNDAANKLLSSWIDIPDIITRDHGLHCSIFLMRDLDMRGAYVLKGR